MKLLYENIDVFNFAFLMGWFYFELTQVFLYFYEYVDEISVTCS